MAGVRKSCQFVQFRADGGGWNVRDSADENSPPPHVFKRAGWPSVPDTTPTPPLLIDTHSPQFLRPKISQQPERVACVSTETRVLVNEIRLLEAKLENANRQINVQNRIIDGFCKLKIK